MKTKNESKENITAKPDRNDVEGADTGCYRRVNQLGITPAPWEAMIDPCHPWWTVDKTQGTGSGHFMEAGSKEDAHLIAAAPDMYEALLWIKENNDLRYINPIFTKLLNNALNKAEGKTVD